MSTRQRRTSAGNRLSNRRLHRSAIALAVVAALLSAGAQAQESTSTEAEKKAEATELDRVVVTGVRGSVMRAQEIKQEAAQIVDSVTACLLYTSRCV